MLLYIRWKPTAWYYPHYQTSELTNDLPTAKKQIRGQSIDRLFLYTHVPNKEEKPNSELFLRGK